MSAHRSRDFPESDVRRTICRPSSYGESSHGAAVRSLWSNGRCKRRQTLGHMLAHPSKPSKGFRRRTGFDRPVGLCSVTSIVTHDLGLTAHGAPLSLRVIASPSGHGRIEVSTLLLWATFSPSRADGCYPFSSRRMVTSTHVHATREPCTEGGRIYCRSRAHGHRSWGVFPVSLSRVAGCLQDDAPVRRASRLRTTSGGARCAR
jgi:hypothetical protein